MNADHADANLALATALAGLTAATDAVMVGVDRLGFTLRAATPEGPQLARLAFPAPLAGPGEARPAVIALLADARRRA